MYEIVVRSELFGNMALIILYLTALELFTRRNETIFSLLFGLAGGFLLSTRGIVLPIYIIFLGFMIIRKMLKATLFLPSLIGGFLLTLLPFAVWNWNYFVLHGPFAIQLSYIPIWLLVSFILISIILALRIASIKRIYFAISLMLFGIILIPFFISIVRHGFYASVRLDEFDISYFCFTIPFLLIALGGAENGQESTRLLPKTASSIAPR